ncbi:hypothetical protein ACC719_34665, partial [Rhizobium ruizarguesonis]
MFRHIVSRHDDWCRDVWWNAEGRGIVILITILVAAVISIAAGASIRAWAFAIFAFLLAIGFGSVAFADGSSVIAAILFG